MGSDVMLSVSGSLLHLLVDHGGIGKRKGSQCSTAKLCSGFE